MSKTHFGFESVEETEKAKKVAGVFHSVLIIVIVGSGAKLDLLDLNGDLFLFGLVGTFLLFVEKLAIVDHFTNRRLCFRGDLYEVDTAISRLLYRVPRIHNTEQFTILGYNPNGRYAYSFVRPVQRLTKPRLKPIPTKSSSDSCLLCLFTCS